MAEMPDLGSICAFSGCKQLDFLPFQCGKCSGIYCKIHRVPSSHSCREEIQEEETFQADDKILPLKVDRFLCSHFGCFATELVRFDCSLCARNFCMKHRQCEDHACPKIKQLAQSVPPNKDSKKPTTSRFAKKLTDPQQQLRADKVSVMKARMLSAKAIAPADQIVLFVDTWDKRRAALIVGKSWSVVRTLDMISKELDEHQLRLRKADGTLLISDSKLSDGEELIVDLKKD